MLTVTKELRDAYLQKWALGEYGHMPSDAVRDLDALIASVREDVLEEAAKACEGNGLVSGSIGPLMNVGWCSCQTACARAIRNLKGGS